MGVAPDRVKGLLKIFPSLAPREGVKIIPLALAWYLRKTARNDALKTESTRNYNLTCQQKIYHLISPRGRRAAKTVANQAILYQLLIDIYEGGFEIL